MPLANQAPATRISLIYLTVGSIMTVWTIIWLIYYMANPPAGNMLYIVFGFMATGLVLGAIGLGVGSLGRSAKTAETPPTVMVAPPNSTIPPGAPQVVATPINVAAVPAAATGMPNVEPATSTYPVVNRARDQSAP